MILEILQGRPKSKPHASKFHGLATEIREKASNHLKKVVAVLEEFDMHDETHCLGVLQNIENLIGEEQLKSLSDCELFLLYMASYLHDCGMAPADWEVKLMELTEGTDRVKLKEESIAHDLQKPMEHGEAFRFVCRHKGEIYEKFAGKVDQWMFSPSSEKNLQEYLAELLIEYQQFRNGYAESLKNVKKREDFEPLNRSIRIDFIRHTHAVRSEGYVKNMSRHFSTKLNDHSWGEKLAGDLGRVCRSHGENLTYIEQLSRKEPYFNDEEANLQFVAMMLRLGDIIHFSAERAPVEIRTGKIFESDYSFLQWAVKDQGVRYSIEGGEISFSAYCKKPELYFMLHDYIDGIDAEIQNYFRFDRGWTKHVLSGLKEEVNRERITNDTLIFQPQRGLCFRLDQPRIIDLLMGVGLYKDKYACLRELYQNSLDACKCRMAMSKSRGVSCPGEIEFGLQREEEGTYLYCRDNGTGMSRHIIEDFLLNIGNSYYKSAEFFRNQASWGDRFTPVSQFGIGILSCFMICDKMEIITKMENGDYISCVVDGPHKRFYYKDSSPFDRDMIKGAGTLIKLLLKKEVEAEILDCVPEKWGLPLFFGNDYWLDELADYQKYFSNRKTYLFNILQGFITVVPDNVPVKVRCEEQFMEIRSKPFVLDNLEKYGLNEQDVHAVDDITKKYSYKYSDFRDVTEACLICVEVDTTEYRTILCLPTDKFSWESGEYTDVIPHLSRGFLCIDGIQIEHSDFFRQKCTVRLRRSGLLNYLGTIRPQLSVDRASIVGFPDECERISEKIMRELVRIVIEKTNEHLKKYGIAPGTKISNVAWDCAMNLIQIAEIQFIKEIGESDLGNIQWSGISNITGTDCSIKDFYDAKRIELPGCDIRRCHSIVKQVFLSKLMSADRILVSDKKITVESNGTPLPVWNEKNDIFIAADEWELNEYDMVTNKYALIPRRLFCLLDDDREDVNDRVKIVGGKNGIIYRMNNLGILYDQNPLLINEELGLYQDFNNSFGGKASELYNFSNMGDRIYPLERMVEGSSEVEFYMIYVFISPIKLSEEQERELEKLAKIHPEYAKGVREGWSLLVTGMDKYNVVVKAGEAKREELVARLPDDFWEMYSKRIFKFTDGTLMTKIG